MLTSTLQRNFVFASLRSNIQENNPNHLKSVLRFASIVSLIDKKCIAETNCFSNRMSFNYWLVYDLMNFKWLENDWRLNLDTCHLGQQRAALYWSSQFSLLSGFATFGCGLYLNHGNPASRNNPFLSVPERRLGKSVTQTTGRIKVD